MSIGCQYWPDKRNFRWLQCQYQYQYQFWIVVNQLQILTRKLHWNNDVLFVSDQLVNIGTFVGCSVNISSVVVIRKRLPRKLERFTVKIGIIERNFFVMLISCLQCQYQFQIRKNYPGMYWNDYVTLRNVDQAGMMNEFFHCSQYQFQICCNS